MTNDDFPSCILPPASCLLLPASCFLPAVNTSSSNTQRSQSLNSWKLMLAIHLGSYGSFLVFTLYFLSGGEGSYVPFIIFWGWAALPFALDPNTPAFLFPPILQTLTYAVIWVVARSGRIPSPVLNALPLLHVAGSIISFYKLSFGHRDLTSTFGGTVFYLVSYLVPTVLLVVYWIVYLRTARTRP